MVEVRIFATLRVGREKIYHYDNVHSIQEVLDKLEIPAKEVAICLINGFHSKPEDSIKDGDVISLFPPAGGG